MPNYKGSLQLQGINQQAEVHYDEFGVPHIYANSESDAYQVLGYVHAQERLFQMDLIRRVCEGRLSEIFGEDLVNADKYFRTLGMDRHAEVMKEQYFNSNNEPYQKAALAYLDGINAFIKSGGTPPEFTILGIKKQEFDEADLLQVAGYMALGFAGGIEEDLLVNHLSAHLDEQYLRELAIDWVDGTERIVSHPVSDSLLQDFSDLQSSIRETLPIPLLIGSNSWVLGPKKSASGYAVLCNDTHIGFRQPAVWFEAHLNYPGNNFFGKFLAGFPFAPVGNNEHTAVGLTMLENDDTNLHLENINDELDMYMQAGEWIPLQKFQDTIQVKDGDAIPFEINQTSNGPIISNLEALPLSESKEAISLWWLYQHNPGNFLKAAYLWSLAKDLDDVREAAALVGSPGLNAMYADTDKNIAWFATAKLPVFENENSKFVMASHEAPIRFLEFFQNPHSVNPPEGYVYSANNQPEPYAGFFHPGYYVPEDRAKRIKHQLDSKEKWTIDDLKDLQFDNISATYQSIIQVFKDENIQDSTISILDNWDGNHNLDATEPSIYNYLISYILELSFKDEMGDEAFTSFLSTHLMKRTIHDFVQNESSIWWDDIETAEKETRKDILTSALQATQDKLTESFGENVQDWTWGKLHTITHKHSFDAVPALRKYFNVGPAPSPGGNMVINNTGYKFDTDSKFDVTYGPAMRTIVHMADPIEVYTILPSGQSGHFLSPHYGDQFDMYNKGLYRRVHLKL